jgi:hypothetical protein
MTCALWQAGGRDVERKRRSDYKHLEVNTMVVSTRVQELLEKTLAILPITDEDVIFKGIKAEVMNRIVELKKAALRFQTNYGSLEDLTRRVERDGVSPDDHTLYTDLLEWRAINYELGELVKILESI